MSNLIGQTQAVEAKSAIEKLLTIRDSYELTISQLKPKVEKMLSLSPDSKFKVSALNGIKAINENIDSLKEQRLTETRKIDEVKAIFTSYEKSLVSMREQMQEFANKCLDIELKEIQAKQAEEMAEANKKNEMIEYEKKCRDYILEQISECLIEINRLIRYVMDSHNPFDSPEILVENIRKVEFPKIKNKLPVHTFKFNLNVSEDAKKEMYLNELKKLKPNVDEMTEKMQKYIQDAILMASDFVKAIREDEMGAKKQVEAKAVLQEAEIMEAHSEIEKENSISDVFSEMQTVVPEIVVAGKKEVIAEIASHAGCISLSKWYFTQPEFQKKTLNSLEKISIGMMLTLAKKNFAEDQKFELNGIEFEVKTKAV